MAEHGKNILFVLTMVTVLAMAWVWNYALGNGPATGRRSGEEIRLVIPPGASFHAIEDILAQTGLIVPGPRFRLVAGLMGVADKLKAGDYAIKAGSSPYKILKRLSLGAIHLQPLTIPEGYNIVQIDQLFSDEGWAKKGAVTQLARDPDFIKALGLNVDSLEGYLFPDTYLFIRGGQDAKELLTTMVKQNRKVIDSLGVKQHLKHLGLNLHQFLTLASIIEKESGRVEEQTKIARVFLNRLKKGMRLQADPTVIYGISNFDGNLTKKELLTPGPYNTYLNQGLPPGPICNPGRSAMKAILRPARWKYLYFVSKNDGSHYFSSSLSRHNRAVARYQKHRRRR